MPAGSQLVQGCPVGLQPEYSKANSSSVSSGGCASSSVISHSEPIDEIVADEEELAWHLERPGVFGVQLPHQAISYSTAPSCPPPDLITIERRWEQLCALRGDGAWPSLAMSWSSDAPLADGMSLVVSSVCTMSLTLSKPADERLMISLPNGETLDLGGQSIAPMEMPLGQWLLKARTDLTYHVGHLSAEARRLTERAATLLLHASQLRRPDAPWFRVSLVDALGRRRRPWAPSAHGEPALVVGGPSPMAGGPSMADGRLRLPSHDLAGIAACLAAAPPRSVVVMVGAGLSVAAGIPDFRSPGSGLYDNLQSYGLPYPEAVFDLGYFVRHPAPFYRLCAQLWPGNYAPTAAHRFLAMLDAKRKLRRCFSQNIDSLETAAGLSSERLVAAHGNFDAAYVVPCAADEEDGRRGGGGGGGGGDGGGDGGGGGGGDGDGDGDVGDVGDDGGAQRADAPSAGVPSAGVPSADVQPSGASSAVNVPVAELREAVAAGEGGPRGWRALNARYGGLVKPAITFFGEALPRRFGECAVEDFDESNCSMLLILGTSLKVQPFASLVHFVDRGTPRLLVNRARVGEHLGLDFARDDDRTQDVFYEGDCDDAVRELCALLGWEQP